MGRRRSLTPKRCEIERCGERHYAKGFCRKHYQYNRRVQSVAEEAVSGEMAGIANPADRLAEPVPLYKST
ncbi:hypothetical protein ACFFNY_11185 [Paenibacillus hodogayensis]|uniref:Vegetative protein n=1 Tax=Paenibacillus hodogayensis TaxID=279208 RepID=A0ABV5VVF4_9BACL